MVALYRMKMQFNGQISGNVLEFTAHLLSHLSWQTLVMTGGQQTVT